MGKIGVLRCVAAAASAVCLPALSANFPEPQSFATVGLITYSVEDTNPGDGIDAGVFLIQPDSVHGIDMTAVSGSLSVADFQSPGVQDVLQTAALTWEQVTFADCLRTDAWGVQVTPFTRVTFTLDASVGGQGIAKAALDTSGGSFVDSISAGSRVLSISFETGSFSAQGTLTRVSQSTARFDQGTVVAGQVVAIPEPSTYALMLVGLLALYSWGQVARATRQRSPSQSDVQADSIMSHIAVPAS